MPTDLARIVANLAAFYPFAGKDVVHVGAGGGQLMGYARPARRVVAVDRDGAALERLRQRLAADGLDGVVSVALGDFLDLDLRGDVVLLEFCLHEMADPTGAIARARTVAPDVVVIDHRPESRWSWFADEDRDMARAWDAVTAAGARRTQDHEAVQEFADYDALRARFAGQSAESHRRIEELRGRTPVTIPMPYGIALV